MDTRIDAIMAGKAAEIYYDILRDLEFTEPHKFIKDAYEIYRRNYVSNPSINGRIFEYLICETLVLENIVPLYYQCSFSLVPNVEFDIILYHPKAPVVLSAKTSLRERYKQADLEGMALKWVYRDAKTFLLTLTDECYGVEDKIEQGEVNGIERCLRADTDYYDALLSELGKKEFIEAQPFDPIKLVQKTKILP